MRSSVVVSLFVLLAGCAHVAPPTQAMDLAAEHLTDGSSAEDTALAAFRALLMEGDATRAQALFDRAVARDAHEPLALLGQTFVSLRNVTPRGGVEAALGIVEHAPDSPLAPVAARMLADTAASSTSFGALLHERLPPLLSRRLPPDVSHLLRLALANSMTVNEVDAQRALFADMGVPTVGTLVGPFSAWHVLETGEPTPPERSGRVDDLAPGPFGPLAPRVFHFADGHLSLSGEPSQGDVYVYAVDVTVPEAATFVLRTVTSLDHVAVVDGTKVLERFTTSRPAPTLTTRALKLDAGTHRLLVRMARENQAGQLVLNLQRADGRPAGLTFAPATGAAAAWGKRVDVLDDHDGLYASAESVRAALEPRYGDALARIIAARDALGRDRDAARGLLGGLPATVDGPMVGLLRAETFIQDRAMPSRVSRGRTTRELEAALAKDPGFVVARLLSAQLALDDGRFLDALDQARAARDAHAPASAPTLQLIARIQLGMGLDAAAAATAKDAEAALPGWCDALVLQYELALRRDAVSEADALLEKTAGCSGYLLRSAEHYKRRGRLAASIAQWEAMLARDEGQVNVATTLVGLYLAERRYDDALKLLRRLEQQWPRNAQLWKTEGDVLDLAGRPPDALAAREHALTLDGADLSLRRRFERQKTGREVLDAYAISTAEALKSYEALPGSEDATSAFILDAAAIEGFADGAMVDRVHIIQKALDQQGVQDIAEVDLPAGAEVLTLRTIKPDGRTLEPERIDGKDGAVSLPGVQVGDLVEYEYLLAHPTRGPALPGFTASAFYFQIARQPNARSTYVVIAPKGSGLEVDAHHVKAPRPELEGDVEVFRHEERRVPPYIPEPDGPPSANEWLPFVSVGTGQHGNEGLVRLYADGFAGRALVTWEVQQFADEVVKDLPRPLTEDAVKAVYAAVQKRLTGRDAGLSVSAAASLAQDRGSRTWLLKATLEALGFETRVVAVRAFTADPAPYTFPNEALLPYVCLRVKVGDRFVWLDPFVHWAPYGELPEFALGEREAWVLPEPGRALERTASPARSGKPGKTVVLELSLSETGELSGKGVETYEGFDAAQLAEALEQLSEDQRDQALQSALSRYYGGADLSKLQVDLERGVGRPVVVRYEFVAHRFAREEGAGRLLAASLTYPLMLGRRFVGVPSRVTPLFIEGSEHSVTTATLTLPPGWVLDGPVPEVKLEGPSGSYLRHEAQTGQTVTVDENFSLLQSRVPPKDYEAFGQFAGEVDLVQQRELLFRKQ